MRTFEELEPIIDNLLEKNRSRWRLEVIKHYDFDDFKQDAKLHIWSQFSKWDQIRAFEPWCSTVIKYQLINKKRNLFSNHSKPCSDCHYNKGMGSCGFTKSGTQCSECPAFLKWEKSKKSAYEMKTASSVEAEDGEIFYRDHGDVNYDGFLASFPNRYSRCNTFWIPYWNSGSTSSW